MCTVAVIELKDWQTAEVNIDPKHELGERCTEVQVRLTHNERSVCLIDLGLTPECLTPCHQKMNVRFSFSLSFPFSVFGSLFRNSKIGKKSLDKHLTEK